MKIFFYLLAFTTTMFTSVHSNAADTLFLKINGLSKAKIVLQLNNNSPFKDTGTLKPTSNPWVLKVITNSDARIIMKNTDGGASDTLEAASKAYVINNNKLSEDFAIASDLRIEVLKKESEGAIKVYQLKYKPGTSDASANSVAPDKKNNAEGLPLPTGYKIGSPIYDAYNLAKGNNSFKTQILIHYTLHPESENLDLKDYKGNKFLEPVAQQFVNKAGDQSKLDLSQAVSSIGGLDVTSLADGLAKFIVKRAKQELSISFFQKFKKVIQQTPDIATVFPQTAALLLAIDDEIYDYQRYLQNLREAFKRDIAEIHRNIPGIVDNHPAFFSSHQPAKAALLTACYIASQLEDESHPGDILANYPVEYLDAINNTIGKNNFKGAIQTIQLISASLKDTSSQGNANYWAGIEQIRKLINDKDVFKMYLGLIYQQAKIQYGGIQFEKTDLLTILNTVAEKYEQDFSIYTTYRSYILRFGEKAVALNNMIKEQQKESLSDSAKVEKYANYFRTSVDLIEYCTQTFQLPIIKDNTSFNGFDKKLKKYFDVSYAAADITSAITRKNYSAAINSAVDIYNLVTVKPASENLATTATNAPNSNETASSPDSLKNTLVKLVRYGSFMATVATAKNSDEVSSAIESAALPVGSARIKRETQFNVSLNAYAGLFTGYEKTVVTGYCFYINHRCM